MSGGDVGPLGAEAVTEIHRLFHWARTSRRGVLLFIDEAEAFLGSRGAAGTSEHRRNALNALLFHTGDSSIARHFFLVLATNRPGDLDAAVRDRVDEAVEFHLPGPRERRRLAAQYLAEHVGRLPSAARDAEPSAVQAGERAAARARAAAAPLGSARCAALLRCVRFGPRPIHVASDVDDKLLTWVSDACEGMSGREITKLAVAVQNAAYAADECAVNAAAIRSIVTGKREEHARQQQIAESGTAWS